MTVLKSRYSGERQAEKHRAELQIQRRKTGDSLCELHQDIRTLKSLAYPEMTADAREPVSYTHLTLPTIYSV